MLLSLAGSTQPAPAQAPTRAETQNTTTNVVALRPGAAMGTPPATTVAPPPVTPALETPATRGAIQDFQPLLQAQARAQREDDLRRLGQSAANEVFQSAMREFDREPTDMASLTLRNGVMTLRLRSEADARLAQDLYDRYQNSRLLGATEDEIAELEARFARLAGWPPLPPVRAETAHGGSLRGISDAITILDAKQRTHVSETS